MRAIIVLLLIVGIGCAHEYWHAYSWTKLDHNPWKDSWLNGNLVKPSPGWDPAKMSIEEIHRVGRRRMIFIPALFFVFASFLVVGWLAAAH